MSQVVRSEAQFFAGLPAAVFALENYHMRTSRLLAQLHGLDSSSALVFVTICLATARPDEPASPRIVSRLAIAQSVGLARETVRRKCALLAKAGLILDCGRQGVSVAPGAALFEQAPGVLRQALADVHQLIETLFRLGVFTAVDDGEADRRPSERVAG